MNRNLSKLLLVITPLILITIYAYLYTTRRSNTVLQADIASFEECAAAGYPVVETYPETCRVPGGTTYTRVTTGDSPTQITISGTYTCLPKVDTGGPVTMECAFGLKTESGYYSLDMSSILTDNYPALYGNETITVEGVLVPKEMLSSDRWKTYDVVGVISVDKITKQ